MKLISKSGRVIESPSVRLSTNRKCAKDLKKLHEWLLDETKKEYVGKTDATSEFILLLLNGMEAKHLSPSDQESLLDLLFPENTDNEPLFELIEIG